MFPRRLGDGADFPVRESGSAYCPEEPAEQNFKDLRSPFEIFEVVSKRRVEDASFAVMTCPDNRHDRSVDPRSMLSVETGGGEHMIAGIGVHVILFAVNGEIADSGEERILRLHDIHDIVNGVSRMRGADAVP